MGGAVAALGLGQLRVPLRQRGLPRRRRRGLGADALSRMRHRGRLSRGRRARGPLERSRGFSSTAAFHPRPRGGASASCRACRARHPPRAASGRAASPRAKVGRARVVRGGHMQQHSARARTSPACPSGLLHHQRPPRCSRPCLHSGPLYGGQACEAAVAAAGGEHGTSSSSISSAFTAVGSQRSLLPLPRPRPLSPRPLRPPRPAVPPRPPPPRMTHRASDLSSEPFAAGRCGAGTGGDAASGGASVSDSPTRGCTVVFARCGAGINCGRFGSSSSLLGGNPRQRFVPPSPGIGSWSPG